MRNRLLLGMGFLPLLLAASMQGPAVAADPPTTLTITGHLVDDSGAPLDGRRVWRVRFYDAQAGGTQLGSTQWDYMQVSDKGMFAIPVLLPSAALTASQVWYELAIDGDSPADGLQARDVFSERVAVRNVPFAIESQHLSGTVEATQVGGGFVEDAEFDRLDGVTGNIQTQLDAKLGTTGTAHVIVETTDNAVTNALNLRAAYLAARALTPNGQALAADNRAAVLVPPGRYYLGTGALVLDTEFVDLIGLTTDRAAQHIYGEAYGAGSGVIEQTADDVRIENLTVECTEDSYTLSHDNTDPAAYFPDSNLPQARVQNCEFRSNSSHARTMRTGIHYSGTYIDCSAEAFAFGGSNTGTAWATGSFIDCEAGDYSFGSTYTGSALASGEFIRCQGGLASFGAAVSPGTTAEASGTFIDCTGGYYAFGGANQGTAVASGKFLRCTGKGAAFGGTSGGTGTASGVFRDCKGEQYAFGGTYEGTSTASGDFIECDSGGANFVFGSAWTTSGTATASGNFTACSAGQFSFGSSSWGTATASGTFIRCDADQYSFGATYMGSATSTGDFHHCKAGPSSFSDPSTSVHLFCIRDDAQYANND